MSILGTTPHMFVLKINLCIIHEAQQNNATKTVEESDSPLASINVHMCVSTL